MLSNILKWTFKEGEDEAHLFLKPDANLVFVKEIAYQIVKHCGQIEEQQKAIKSVQEAAEKSKSAEPALPVEEAVKPPDAVV